MPHILEAALHIRLVAMREHDTAPAGEDDGISAGGLLGRLALYVVLGAPLVYFVWHFLNEALSGELHGDSAALAAAGLLGLVWLLRLVARQINRWEEGT